MKLQVVHFSPIQKSKDLH